MKIIAYLLGFLVHWVVYVVAINVFGENGFLFYLGTLLSEVIGAYLGAILIGYLQYKNNGTRMNFLIPILFFLTIIGGIIGVIRGGLGEIWEYLVSLVGLFIAFGFFNMHVVKKEGGMF